MAGRACPSCGPGSCRSRDSGHPRPAPQRAGAVSPADSASYSVRVTPGRDRVRWCEEQRPVGIAPRPPGAQGPSDEQLSLPGPVRLVGTLVPFSTQLAEEPKGLNNRAENSHRPVRKRERVLGRFKSPEHAQQFLEPFSAVCNHFRPRRHLLPAVQYRQIRAERFQQWREAARLQRAA
jgi:hypothetical protein